MSKQKRPPQRAKSSPQRAEDSEKASSVEAQRELGNHALQQAVSGVEGALATVDIESVRAEGMAAVERGVFAVNTEPRAPERVAHFVSVIESSKLPADRKAVLVDKLVGDQEAAVAMHSTVERLFGGEGVENCRDRAREALEATWQALQSDLEGMADRQGSIGERADQLIVDLAADPEMGERVRDLCRGVYLIGGWLEEEEEEEEEDWSALSLE